MSRAAGASLTGDPAHGGPCPHMHWPERTTATFPAVRQTRG